MKHSADHIQQLTSAGLNLITQALSIYDNDLQLVVANDRFQKMFDLPAHLATTGASFEGTIRYLVERGDYGDVNDIEAFVRERLTQAEAFEPHYFERTRPNGMTISVEGVPLEEGGWVTVYTDISGVKAQEDLLRNHSANLSEELLSRSEELSQTNRALLAMVKTLEETKRYLTASQDRLNLTNAMTPAHIARVGRDGIYTYSNHKLHTILPGRSSDVIGKHFSDALGQDVYQRISPDFDRALNGEAPVLEFSDTKSSRHIRIAFTPEMDDEDHVVGVYLLSTDVTEEVNARQALVHARRRELAAQLTSGLAHDFNNLLTIILGQQGRLEAQPNLSPVQQEISQIIRSAAFRGAALIDDLSKVDAKRELETRPVHIPTLLENFALLAHAALPTEAVLTIKNELPDTDLMLDAGFAQDALLNLVLNAGEALDGPGSVMLTLQRDDGPTLRLSVQDNGPGFTEHALKNALSPFYTSKRGKPGRGLGLSTAFDFAKSCGGRINLGNVDAGGAEIILHLPYQTPPQDPPGLILLVEDDPTLREMIRAQLRDLGHAVIETDNVPEAVRLAQVPDVTLVLTDVMLADGGTGLALSGALQAAGLDLPLRAITGLPKDDPIRQALACKHPVLNKPFTLTALKSHLQIRRDPE
jgi:signal transduction histidine kinase